MDLENLPNTDLPNGNSGRTPFLPFQEPASKKFGAGFVFLRMEILELFR